MWTFLGNSYPALLFIFLLDDYLSSVNIIGFKGLSCTLELQNVETLYKCSLVSFSFSQDFWLCIFVCCIFLRPSLAMYPGLDKNYVKQADFNL